jgi:hypothetical protein
MKIKFMTEVNNFKNFLVARDHRLYIVSGSLLLSIKLFERESFCCFGNGLLLLEISILAMPARGMHPQIEPLLGLKIA